MSIFFNKFKFDILLLYDISTNASDKYKNFADIFSYNLATQTLEYIKIKDDVIDQINIQYEFYASIYSLRSILREMLITYIEVNLTNSFIKSSKFYVKIPIFLKK